MPGPVEGDVDSAYTVDDHPVISVDKEVTVVGKDDAIKLATRMRSLSVMETRQLQNLTAAV